MLGAEPPKGGGGHREGWPENGRRSMMGLGGGGPRVRI